MDPNRPQDAPYQQGQGYGDNNQQSWDAPQGPPEGQESDRNIIGDTYNKYKTEYNQYYAQGKPHGAAGSSGSKFGAFVFDKIKQATEDITSEVDKRFGSAAGKTQGLPITQPSGQLYQHAQNKYESFAPPRLGNDIKWYVDGCGYFWAVSKALEQATQSIWILDWWLSPELYLRRPPSRNERYRVDRMLQAAAQRGVKVNIIVYKEVTQALTLSSSHTKHALESLHPNIAVFRHPDHLPDAQTLESSFNASLQNLGSLTAKKASTLPQDALKAIYGMNDDVILYWAHHEKLLIVDGRIAFMGGLDLCFGRWDTNQHPIVDCHPSNLEDIVFPGQDYNNARIMDFEDVAHWENNKLNRKESARMGWSDISICLKGAAVEDLKAHFVDRWNFIYNEKYDVRQDARYHRLALNQATQGTANQPPAAGVNQVPSGLASQPPSGAVSQPPTQATGPNYQPYHPSGQSAQQPSHGVGSDGFPPPPPGPPPNVQGGQYPLPPSGPPPSGEQTSYQYPPPPPMPSSQTPSYQPAPAQTSTPYFPPPPSSATRGIEEERSADRGYGGEPQYQHPHSFEQRMESEARGFETEARGLGGDLRGRFEKEGRHLYQHLSGPPQQGAGQASSPSTGISCQIVRSCTKWSAGIPTEHSIANAYISVIENSQHFVYIENQFFITATSDAQEPVKNKIGDAIVRRVLRAAKAGQKYKIFVVIPSVPGFAGDLRDDSSLGTRAIMEFQYNSINRGGHSIMESIAKEGFNPIEYIRFYNLRNYDRINISETMREAEQQSGVSYEDARIQYETAVELPAEVQRGQMPEEGKYHQYQQATSQLHKSTGDFTGVWDSVSECYMEGGRDIREVPWKAGGASEMDAFVSEELYIHTKVLIADDRTVICGSANLNDRSQLGDHDSEIAVIVEDSHQIGTTMNGQPYRASHFAATLRRQLFRKHLGLVKPQNMERPDANFETVEVAPNTYDLGSPEDRVVADPLADTFLNLWNSRARTNTAVFGKCFHAVPHDSVRTWKDYDSFYERYFKKADKEAEQGKTSNAQGHPNNTGRYQWGHVVAEEFSPGAQGVQELKGELAKVKGTLVEMPLLFLIDEDIAKEGLTLNAFTEEVYT